MPDNEELEMFVGEVGECLEVIEEGVLQLEQKGAKPELVNRLFTATHNIKGASSIFGFPELEKLAHSMEDLLTALRKQVLEVSPPMVDTLLTAKDTLRNLLNSFSAGAPLPESSKMSEQLRAFLAKPVATGATKQAKEELRKALIKKSKGKDLSSAFLVFVFLNPGCRLLEVRLIQLDRTIAKLGTVLEYVPEGASIQDNIPASHEKLVALQTSLAPEEIKEVLLKVPDVIEVVVEPFSKAPAVSTIETAPEILPPEVKTEDIPTALSGITEHSLRIQISTLSIFSQNVAEIMGGFSRVRSFLNTLKTKRGAATVFELAGVEEIVEHLQLMLDQLQQDSIEMRFVPMDTLFSQLRRMVRKLARELGKEVNLEIQGGEVKLDGAVVEWIKEPLIHIVRNSMDHGLESPEERKKAGKNPVGALTISATSQTGHIQIVVGDDGHGIVSESVVSLAIEKGVITKEAAAKLTDEEMLDLLFAPGFSTRKDVTELSGRGVGLDVVKKNLEEIKGSCRIETIPGKGTNFIIRVPSTMLIQKLLFFTVRDRNYAVPLSDVFEIIRASQNSFIKLLDRTCLQLGKETVTVYYLEKILGLAKKGRKEQDKLLLLIVRTLAGKAAFVIDEIQQEAERVIKPLPSVIAHIPEVLGVTLNDMGEPLLVLNPLHLVATFDVESIRAIEKELAPEKRIPLAMVVDDSQLIREVLRDILEREGYKVSAMINGDEAMRYAKNTHIDLIVTDIDMPVMNGFDLLKMLRTREEHIKTPVVMISGKATNEEKRLGLELGATAYVDKTDLQKQSFVNLLKTLRES